MITETKDVFEVAATDLVVTTYRRNFSSSQLEFQSPKARWTLTIEGAFDMTRNTGEESTSTMPLLADLIGESVLLLRARKADGELELRFTHDWVLTVEADPEYEAWQLLSNRGDMLVAVPGNGIARWREET